MDLKSVSLPTRGRYTRGFHIETELGIINIYCKLHDTDGRAVESIEIIPDNYAGEAPVILEGHVRSRLIRSDPPYTPTPAPCPRFYQHMSAPRDTNGNPRRLFVVYELQTTAAAIVAVYEEDYSGVPAGLRNVPAIEEVDISLADYRRIIRDAKQKGHYNLES